MKPQHVIRHAYRVLHSKLHELIKRHARSPEWRHIEKIFLRANPRCAACGGIFRLQVHHIAPFHLYPTRELDLSNLIALCMGPSECHLLIGHGGSFKAFNPYVVVDSRMVRAHPERRAVIETRAHANRSLE